MNRARRKSTPPKKATIIYAHCLCFIRLKRYRVFNHPWPHVSRRPTDKRARAIISSWINLLAPFAVSVFTNIPRSPMGHVRLLFPAISITLPLSTAHLRAPPPLLLSLIRANTLRSPNFFSTSTRARNCVKFGLETFPVSPVPLCLIRHIYPVPFTSRESWTLNYAVLVYSIL